MQCELEYFSAVFVTLLHPKLLPSVGNFLPEGFCNFMLWITLPLSLWNHIMGRLRRPGVLTLTASETQWTGSFLNFVMPPRSAILFYTFNHGYSRHTGLSIPQTKENFITVGFRPSKQDLATFLERIWNRYYLDFFYLTKGGTFSTSDPVTLQSVTLFKAKSDFPIERAANQREVELRRRTSTLTCVARAGG